MQAVEELSASLVTKGRPLSTIQDVTLDSYEFNFSYLRNKETIIRIGGAPTRIYLAGVEDQGKKRAPMSNVDCILLAAAFSVEGVLNKLDLLHLHDNQIGAQGMACLVAAMQCGTSDCLKALGQLHLTGNPIGDIGIKQLANAIER